MDEKLVSFNSLFENAHHSVDFFKQIGLKGEIKTLRSLFWMIFLDYIPSLHQDTFSTILIKERSGYQQLREKFIFDPNDKNKGNLNLNNPLSLEVQSPWTKYFADTELKKVIQQDVERTANSIQRIMLDILFIWCKVNPDLNYRQGMHELLGTILYVVHEDRILLSSEKKEENHLIYQLFDINYLEHDTSVLFFKLMRNVKVWYETNPISTSFHRKLDLRNTTQNFKVIPIISICQRIQYDLLQVLDYDLYRYLEQLNIEPQLYGIRWIRLLFCREFEFESLLLIWDGLFADDPNLNLVEWLCVSMLIYLREEIIGMDYNHVLQKLMKFPSKLVIPSWQFIQMAIENKNLYAEKSFSQLNSPVIEGNLLPSPQNPQPQPVTKTFSFPSVSPSYPSSKEENKYQPENSQLHQEQISFLHDKLEGIEKRDKILINTINSVTEELGQLDNEDSETVEVSKSKINLMLKKLENCVQIITKYEEKESKGSAQNFEEKSWFGKVASVDEIRSGVDPELAKDFSKFTSSSTTELNDTSTKLVASVASVATSVTAGLKKWGVF